MASERFNVELDSRFVENFYGLVDMPSPAEVTLESLNDVVAKIKAKFSNMALSSAGLSQVQASSQSKAQASSPYMMGGVTDGTFVRPKTVLIVDDLGIITYQLEVLFKKMGYDVIISHEVYDAIEKFKKQDFGYAIIDLFIPTEREGFMLLDELKKLALLCKLNTRIIVMTASSRPDYETKCTNRGADFYVEKSPGWQKNIMEACTTK